MFIIVVYNITQNYFSLLWFLCKDFFLAIDQARCIKNIFHVTHRIDHIGYSTNIDSKYLSVIRDELIL